MSKTHARTAVLAVVTAALLLVACGSSGKSTATTAQEATTAAPATTVAPTTVPAPSTTAAPQATGGDINACHSIETAINDASGVTQPWVNGNTISVSANDFTEMHRSLVPAIDKAAESIDNASLATMVAALADHVRPDLMDKWTANSDTFGTDVYYWLVTVDGYARDVTASCTHLGYSITIDKLVAN